MEYDLYKNIGYADVCTELEMPEVKVPIIFFGAQGFSARRDGRYPFISIKKNISSMVEL